MYLPGHFFTFELAGGAVPAAGHRVDHAQLHRLPSTAGSGAGGDDGPYTFTAGARGRFTAVGCTSLRLGFNVVEPGRRGDATAT